MPGLPRPRLARLLRRRNADDARRASSALIVGALAALAFAVCGSTAGALVAEMGASLDLDDHAPPAIRATQEAALAGAELARVGVTATMDGVIDADERVTLRAQSSRCRKALDVLDASLARAEARPS